MSPAAEKEAQQHQKVQHRRRFGSNQATQLVTWHMQDTVLLCCFISDKTWDRTISRRGVYTTKVRLIEVLLVLVKFL